MLLNACGGIMRVRYPPRDDPSARVAQAASLSDKIPRSVQLCDENSRKLGKNTRSPLWTLANLSSLLASRRSRTHAVDTCPCSMETLRARCGQPCVAGHWGAPRGPRSWRCSAGVTFRSSFAVIGNLMGSPSRRMPPSTNCIHPFLWSTRLRSTPNSRLHWRWTGNS
jgi:hypothetical protein